MIVQASLLLSCALVIAIVAAVALTISRSRAWRIQHVRLVDDDAEEACKAPSAVSASESDEGDEGERTVLTSAV
eukprot:COSAG02_NODE_6140_length_3774_cov_5.563537_2_plen_74_part_00